MPMPMMSSMGIRGTAESAKPLCHCLPVPTCAVMHTSLARGDSLAACPRRLPANRHAAAIDDESRRIRRGDGRRRRTSIRVRHDRGRGGLALVDQVIREDRADLQDRARARGDHRGLVFRKPSVERKQVFRGPLPSRTLLPEVSDAAGLLWSRHAGVVRHLFFRRASAASEWHLEQTR